MYGVDAYYAWWIEPLDGDCRVMTEDTQYGAVARLEARAREGMPR